ncbi:peptidoglycan DD-metalloendopeptidase family protein [Gemmiger formicilis]|uniref:murein hydrolase activator EnvC family protein n=1 Tax=Gemmiger formicilis TaxID=745368 RepID=UPI00210EAEE5|nr:peptidoglycan DD-metalloendopeptidase family protein [Gemmiger formicilis]MCQ5078590.1 peptidoglycan DD-metalloendopeptidase family protein [Gemmiger formicilis]MCQ5114975.1 peptidoglycan DD-metalloendopeptidase family protein [Gemmiger formicilis]
MKHLSKGKKFISLLLSVAVAMTMTLSTVMTPLAASSSVSDLRQKLQEQQAELEKVNQQLKETQSTKADAQALKQQLEQQKSLLLGQIANLTEQIGKLDNDIVNKQDEIAQKQQEVDQKQAEYDQRWEDFKGRMKAMQRLNDGGSIALLSSATNLYQLLTFATTLEQIVSKDEQICQQLEDEHTQLEQQKAELEQAKADLEATKADYESQKAALDSKTSELAQNISQTNASISEAEAEEQALKEAQIEANKRVDEAAKELDAALNAANQAYGNASIQCSLDFGRPLATYKYVSCYFGGNGHRGTDYAAPGGTSIYAVTGGVVTAAAYHYSWGYYVQVYHGKDDKGNSYSTLYAHMNSAPIVSVGDSVSKGQTLGYVGSTGNSTGNHLHLEMKVNNVLVNVMNYLS